MSHRDEAPGLAWMDGCNSNSSYFPEVGCLAATGKFSCRAQLPLEEAHFCCSYLWSSSFHRYPKLVTIGEGRNTDRQVNCRSVQHIHITGDTTPIWCSFKRIMHLKHIIVNVLRCCVTFFTWMLKRCALVSIEECWPNAHWTDVPW